MAVIERLLLLWAFSPEIIFFSYFNASSWLKPLKAMFTAYSTP